MYHKLGLQWGTTLLAFVAVFVTIPIYVFYWKGPEIRARSKFALILAEERESRVNPEEKPRAPVDFMAGHSYLRAVSGARSRASAVTGPGRAGIAVSRPGNIKVSSPQSANIALV